MQGQQICHRASHRILDVQREARRPGSIDRIDNSRNHVEPGNVQPLCCASPQGAVQAHRVLRHVTFMWLLVTATGQLEVDRPEADVCTAVVLGSCGNKLQPTCVFSPPCS